MSQNSDGAPDDALLGGSVPDDPFEGLPVVDAGPDIPAGSEPEPPSPEPSPPSPVSGVDQQNQELLVPDDLSGLPLPLPLWPADEYKIGGSGAAKLSSSAVAPLVAAVRGYESVFPETAKETAKAIGLGAANSKASRLLTAASRTGDCLLIPLFNIHSVAAPRSDGRPPSPATHQFRPALPLPPPGGGKPAKYLFTPDARVPLDVNPGCPKSWLEDPAAVMIVEGALKADSALTGLLRRWGATDDDLAAPADPAADPVSLLTALAERVVPQDQSVLIVSIAGVGNWHKHPEWTYIPMNGRQVIVGFDGDVASNASVWRQASQMFSLIDNAGGEPYLLDLSGVAIESHSGEHGIGIDDYLANVDRWEKMVRRVVEQLPEQPVEVLVGDRRINGDSHTQEVFTAGSDGDNFWAVEVPLAGVVTQVLTRRSVSSLESFTGVLDSDKVVNTTGEIEVEIEVSWRNPDMTVGSVTLSGPDSLLSVPPDQWHKHGPVPTALGLQPAWPPEGALGRSWWSTVKAHSIEEDTTDASIVWNHMGWVPTRNSPVFIIGNMVIGPNGKAAKDLARPGVNEGVLANSSMFGCMFPKDIDQARSDVIKVLDTYQSTWTDRRIAAAVIATAMRPCVPINPHTPVLMSGAARSGKSWTAASVLSFWQPKPHTWSESRLPGSAKDTFAASEQAASKSAIWVIDDLAPSSDPIQARNDEARIADLIRGSANQTTKRRMTREMKSREAPPVRSVLIFTAENDLSVQSAMDRVVHLRFTAGAIGSDESKQELDRLRDEDGAPARVTGAVLQHFAEQMARPSSGEPHSFKEINDIWAFDMNELRGEAPGLMGVDGGRADRHIDMAIDLALGLRALTDYVEVKLGDRDLGVRVKQMEADLFSLIGEHHRSQLSTSRGRSLLEALRSALSSGRAHLTSVNSDPLPTSGEDAHIRNRALGWSDVAGDHPRPGGPTIGLVVFEGNVGYAMFDMGPAFNAAQKASPDLIPHGSKSGVSWESMWDEGLASGGVHWSRQRSVNGERPNVRLRVGRDVRPVVPVPLDVLLRAAADD